jgi:hypothetical protein
MTGCQDPALCLFGPKGHCRGSRAPIFGPARTRSPGARDLPHPPGGEELGPLTQAEPSHPLTLLGCSISFTSMAIQTHNSPKIWKTFRLRNSRWAMNRGPPDRHQPLHRLRTHRSAPRGAPREVGARAGRQSAITASELLHGVHRADSEIRRGRRERFASVVLRSVEIVSFTFRRSPESIHAGADPIKRRIIIGPTTSSSLSPRSRQAFSETPDYRRRSISEIPTVKRRGCSSNRSSIPTLKLNTFPANAF